MKNEDVSYTLAKKTKVDTSGIYGNLIYISIIRSNQFCVLKSLKRRKMVSFVNFARIASISVGFDLGTLHGYFFSPRLLAIFEFPPRISN